MYACACMCVRVCVGEGESVSEARHGSVCVPAPQLDYIALTFNKYCVFTCRGTQGKTDPGSSFPISHFSTWSLQLTDLTVPPERAQDEVAVRVHAALDLPVAARERSLLRVEVPGPRGVPAPPPREGVPSARAELPRARRCLLHTQHQQHQTWDEQYED